MSISKRGQLPVRYLLKGLSNILQTPAILGSLAGRKETVRLHPLSQSEVQGGPDSSRTKEWSYRLPAELREVLGEDDGHLFETFWACLRKLVPLRDVLGDLFEPLDFITSSLRYP